MNEELLRQVLSQDPGDPRFLELATILERRGGWAEAVEVCLAGLSRNPGFHKGRLFLARLYYTRGMVPFALREIIELRKAFPDSQTLFKLYKKLGGSDTHQSNEIQSGGAPSIGLKPQGSSDSIQGGSKVDSTAANPESSQSTVAEVELDFDVLEMIEKEDKKK